MIWDSSESSSNWSGYVVVGASGSATLAFASWTVPAVTCSKGVTAYSAFWVGIDGFTSKTVEQIGTNSECVLGIPIYYSWYEFYPKLAKPIGSVKAGDVIEAAVSYSAATGKFTVAIEDLATGKIFSSTAIVSGAARNSIEFIAEAPEVCALSGCSLASLANFGSVGFGMDNTKVTYSCGLVMNGQPGNIGSFSSSNVFSVSMVGENDASVVKAQPSSLSLDGSSFSITWENSGP